MRNKGKRAFAALCGIALVIAAAAPGWSQALSQQGYYAELSVAMSVPPLVIAGQSFDVQVGTYSAGPDLANEPLLVFKTPSMTSGFDAACTSTFDRTTHRCPLPPLGASGFDSRAFRMHLSPDARGPAAVGVLASSELIDLGPGNDIAVAATHVHARTELFFDTIVLPAAIGDSSVSWQVSIYNSGPSSAKHVRLSFEGRDAAKMAAQCWYMTHCPASFEMPANGERPILLTAPVEPEESSFHADIVVETNEPLETNPRRYVVPIRYERGALLVDDFE